MKTACEDDLKLEVKSKKCERNYLSKNEMFNKNQIEAKEAGKSCLMFRQHHYSAALSVVSIRIFMPRGTSEVRIHTAEFNRFFFLVCYLNCTGKLP